MAKRGRPPKYRPENGDSPAAVATLEPAGGVSRKIYVDDAGNENGSEAGESLYVDDNSIAIESSTAEIFSEEELSRMEEGQGEAKELLAEPVKGETNDEPQKEEELILGRFKTQEDLEKSYKEMEGTFTRSQQALTEQKQFYEDILKGTQPVQKEQDQPIEIGDDFYNRFNENPQEAASDMAKAIRTQVMDEIKRESSADDLKSTIERIKLDHSDVVIDQNYPILEGLAQMATQYDPAIKTHRQRYDFAIKEFKTMRDSIINSVKPVVQDQIRATETMKEKAKIETATSSVSEKTYSRAEIRSMMINRPDEYERKQGEIMQAYRDGRVR